MRTGFRTVVMAVLFVSLLGEGCKKKKEIPYPDYTSPKNAAVTFARAMERDDVKVAQESSIAGGMEVDLVEAMCHATHSLKQLGKLAHDKFGAEAELTLRGSGSTDASEALAAGEVSFDGDDRATITPTVGQAVVPVHKSEDGDDWKVDVGALIKGDDITRAIPLLKVVTNAATDVYADPAKTAVMSCARLVTRQGLAQWTALGNGIFELTLFSGEIFHLDETSITRIG